MNVEIEYTMKKTVRVEDIISWLEERSQSERAAGSIVYANNLMEVACVMRELHNIVCGNRKERKHA